MNVVVVGAGVFGSWTAHHLRAAGTRVTLVDAYGAANSRASSADESRITRSGYGPDRIYAEWARRSLAMWQAFFADECAGQLALFHRTGVLWLAAGDDDYTRATVQTLRGIGEPLETLEGDGLRRRFPQFAADGISTAILEPDSGILMARRAVQALVAALVRRGVESMRGRAAPVAESAQALPSVTLEDGRRLGADAFVFACGPWLPHVFPDVVGARIRPTRQAVLYFGVPPGDVRFDGEHLPAWVDFPSGVYGVPDLEGRGVKVGLDAHGPPFDPDTGQRVVDAESVETARAWLHRRLPALADAPLVESRVCQYENTSSGDFLIDRHPALENVWIVGGGSGHGFKHGPMVGSYAASLVLGHGVPERRFALAAKETIAARAIYCAT
jgi:sarcosine oxidase